MLSWITKIILKLMAYEAMFAREAMEAEAGWGARFGGGRERARRRQGIFYTQQTRFQPLDRRSMVKNNLASWDETGWVLFWSLTFSFFFLLHHCKVTHKIYYLIYTNSFYMQKNTDKLTFRNSKTFEIDLVCFIIYMIFSMFTENNFKLTCLYFQWDAKIAKNYIYASTVYIVLELLVCLW
jgi:hypothetical protein